MHARNADVDLLGVVLGAALQGVTANGRGVQAARHTDERLLFSRRAARCAALADRVSAALPSGTDAEQATAATRMALADFQQHAQPASWPEVCARAVLLDGLLSDAIAKLQLDDDVRSLLGADQGPDARSSLSEALSEALDADPSSRGSVSLYGRRLLGELLSQVQRVAAANPGLASLLTGKPEGEDVEAVIQMMAELATAHAHRMAELGL